MNRELVTHYVDGRLMCSYCKVVTIVGHQMEQSFCNCQGFRKLIEIHLHSCFSFSNYLITIRDEQLFWKCISMHWCHVLVNHNTVVISNTLHIDNSTGI